MTKAEFLDKLCQGLRFHSDPEEIQKTVNFYAEAIDDRMEDGMTEAEAVAAMGNVEDIVREVRASWRPDGETGDSEPRGEAKRVFSAALVRRINVLDTSGDIHILPSPDWDIHIESTASDFWQYDISGGETVTVRRTKRDAQDGAVNIDLFGRSFTVSIPNFNKVFSTRLELKLLIPAGSAVAVNISSASGDVECREVALDALSVTLADGDVTAEDVSSVGKISLSTASGDIGLRHLSAPEISVNTVSGDMDLEGIETAALTLRSVSGDVNGEDIAAARKLNATAVNGDMDLALSVPCESMTLDVVSGDINLTLPGSDRLYTVATKTSSGDVNISGNPFSGPNIVRVKTMSGDIGIDFQG